MTEQQIDPLGYAAFNYDEARVRELLEAGQDQDTIQRAFVAACWDKSGPLLVDNPKLEAVLLLLLGAGADVNRPDDLGWTPLHNAVGEEGPNLAAIEFLLNKGADPHALTPSGETPLHQVAFMRCDPRAIYRLLRTGIDPTIRNCEGATALDLAQRLLHPEPSRFQRLIERPLERHIEDEFQWYRKLPGSDEFFRDPQILRLFATADWHRRRAGMAEREMQIRETILMLKDAEEDWAKRQSASPSPPEGS
jgi:hypothetical protein